MSTSTVISAPSGLIGRVRAAFSIDVQIMVFSSTLALPIVTYTETRWRNVALVIATSVFLFSLLRLLWLGPILSALLSFSAMIGIFGASKFKFWLTGRGLHALDIYTYLRFDALHYVKHLYPQHYLYLYAGLAFFFLMVIVVLWFEKLKKPGPLNAAIFVVLLLLFVGFAYSWRYMVGFVASGRALFLDNQHTSTFILSAIESLPELVAGHMFEYGDQMPLDPQQVAAARSNSCAPTPGAIYPDVFVILRESIVIPSTIQGMGVPQVNESRFASSDGQTYHLRVEAFGGESAHTIFSLLTGLSVQSFGGMKNIAMDLTPGNLRYSLPLLMRDCGYQTMAITTGNNGYMTSGHFYRSIGFQDYFEGSDIFRRTDGDFSDRAVYGFVSKMMANKNARGPIFVYMDTIASHAPYNYAVRPKESVPEAARIDDPIISEYVRRLIIGERDLENFIEHSRVSSGRDRPLVVLDFGDHQPYFTRDLPGHPGSVNEDRDQDDPQLLTYFRIRSTGPPLAELPADHAVVVDAAFMSDWLVRALDLPIQGIYKIRWSIVERCKSRYWQCEGNAAAHELHQLLRAAGIVSYH